MMERGILIMIKVSAGTPTDTELVRAAKELLAQNELKVQKTQGLFRAPFLFAREMNIPPLQSEDSDTAENSSKSAVGQNLRSGTSASSDA